jgi:hypothetical protein
VSPRGFAPTSAPAGGAALRLVREPLRGVELLFTRGERERGAAIGANQAFVGVCHPTTSNQNFGPLRSSGGGSRLPARPMRRGLPARRLPGFQPPAKRDPGSPGDWSGAVVQCNRYQSDAQSPVPGGRAPGTTT